MFEDAQSRQSRRSQLLSRTATKTKLAGLLTSLLMVGCGSGGGGSPSSSSDSSVSSVSSAVSSSSVAASPDVSNTTALPWDWMSPAQQYCEQHEQVSVVPGTFRVLRPEQSRYLYESEHFVLRWNDGDGVNISQSTIDAALNTLERVWDKYINELHFPEPYHDSATKYKVSVNVSNQGYATGSGTGARDPEMWVHFDALGHIGTLAHEFAHTLQFTTRSMRDSQYVGWLWESHANWMAHLFNPNDVQCTEALVNAPHAYYGSTRNRYCNWQFFEFVKDNSCPAFVNDALWKNGIQPEDPAHWQADPFTTLATNVGWDVTQLNDVFAEWALHNSHWDYAESGDTYRARYGSYSDINGARRFRVTRLVAVDSENTYQVPSYWAPQRWGYNLVELLPEPGQDTIWVDFEGLVQDQPAVNQFPSGAELQPSAPGQPNAGWRWSVVVTQSDGKPRYSRIQDASSGRLRVDLQAGDQSVWLMVMAAPSAIQQIFWDQIYYSIYRYPWQVQLQGAKPASFSDALLGASTGAPHTNGGGWVARSAQVAASVYVGPNAKVAGQAQLSGSARVEDNAIVMDSARVSGSAVVRGDAVISGNATVQDQAVVEGHASVIGGVVRDQARVGALSLIRGNTTISGSAVVATTMNAIDGRSVSGTAQLFGDMELNTSVSKGVFYGFVDSATTSNGNLGASRTGPVQEVTESF